MNTATVPVVTLYEVELTVYEAGKAIESSSSYHSNEDDAKRIASTLSRRWAAEPYRYLVTTSYNNIRIYDKVDDEVRATIIVSESQFVKVG